MRPASPSSRLSYRRAGRRYIPTWRRLGIGGDHRSVHAAPAASAVYVGYCCLMIVGTPAWGIDFPPTWPGDGITRGAGQLRHCDIPRGSRCSYARPFPDEGRASVFRSACHEDPTSVHRPGGRLPSLVPDEEGFDRRWCCSTRTAGWCSAAAPLQGSPSAGRPTRLARRPTPARGSYTVVMPPPPNLLDQAAQKRRGAPSQDGRNCSCWTGGTPTSPVPWSIAAVELRWRRSFRRNVPTMRDTRLRGLFAKYPTPRDFADNQAGWTGRDIVRTDSSTTRRSQSRVRAKILSEFGGRVRKTWRLLTFRRGPKKAQKGAGTAYASLRGRGGYPCTECLASPRFDQTNGIPEDRTGPLENRSTHRWVLFRAQLSNTAAPLPGAKTEVPQCMLDPSATQRIKPDVRLPLRKDPLHEVSAMHALLLRMEGSHVLWGGPRQDEPAPSPSPQPNRPRWPPIRLIPPRRTALHCQ